MAHLRHLFLKGSGQKQPVVTGRNQTNATTSDIVFMVGKVMKFTRSARVNKPTTAGGANAFTPRIPTEIWLHIISFVKESRDLLALSQVSVTFRSLARQSMKTVYLFPHRGSHVSREANLGGIKVLETLHLANLITNLRIRLFCIPTDSGTTCMCGQIDDMLNDAFAAMLKLEDLDIHCAMCLRNGRHESLFNIASQHLQSISFQCYCETQGLLYPEQVLPLPVLRTLEALRWRCGWRTDQPPSKILHNPKVLCNLTALACHGHAKHMEERILAIRPVRRVWVADCWDRFNGNNLTLFKDHPGVGSLTHVIFERFRTLSDIVKSPPLRFANLQHIGTVPSFPNNRIFSQRELHLAPFTSLPHLSSIDAVVLGGRDLWDVGFLNRLRRTHQKLQRVLIHGDKFRVWEFQAGVWEVRTVPRFSAWDIIRGACD